jgi:diguanylate cyclase (GGDEF)-like protein
MLELALCAALFLLLAVLQVLARRNDRAVLERHRVELCAAHDRIAEQELMLETALAAQRAGEIALEERTGALDTTLQHIDQGILMIDAAGVVVVYNHRVTEMLGLPTELLAARPNFDEILKYQWETQEFSRTTKSLQDFVRSGGIVAAPQLYQRERPNGMSLEVRSQPLVGGGVVRTFTDITESKRAQALVERAAMVDELTGLPTRLALERKLQLQLATLPDDRPVNLLHLNLDRFRLLNDARGHEIGDRVLVAVAGRLNQFCESDDIVCRVGGDEFAILWTGSRKAADDFPDRLLAALSEAHVVDGVEVSITASIGVVRVEPNASPATLIRTADIALNRAKDGGRNQVCHYAPSMTVAREQRFQLEQSLREAVKNNAFRLAYQPIIAVESGAIVGYEALLRWKDRLRGEISPGEFIPIAETTGLIVPLGRSALEWACFEAASWPTNRTVAVNLSPAQFQGDNIVEAVQDVLTRSGLAPERLELEVT